MPQAILRPKNWDASGSNSEPKLTRKMEDMTSGLACFRVFRDDKAWDLINDHNGRCLDKLTDREIFFTLRERGHVVLEEECKRMIPRLVPMFKRKFNVST